MLGMLLVVLLALPFFSTSRAEAEEVAIRHNGLTLTANLELAEGKTPADGVLLMVHGTLAHNRMETIAAQQALLKERGISSLAINLSLGIHARRGMFDCASEAIRQRHDDAVSEIAAWVAWLKDQGASTIWLFGHSRGGNQVVLYLLADPDPAVRKAVLLAPMTFDAAKAAAGYEKRFSAPLQEQLRKAQELVRQGEGEKVVRWPGIVYCRNGRGTAQAFLSYHAPRDVLDTPSLLKRLPVPVLVVTAAEDEIFPELATRMKTLADGGKVQHVVVEDANHFFIDFAAEDAADAIAAFLKGE